MYIFFDWVSSDWFIGLFNTHKELIVSKRFEIAGNESTQTIPIIDTFLNKNSLKYDDITNIICVIGPGSFTWIRTISLVVNTLAYIYPHIMLSWVNFFDMYSNHPIVKSSSKRDLFVKYNESAIIEVVKNEDFEKSFPWTIIYGDTDLMRFEREYDLEKQIDYESFFQDYICEDKKTLAPLYFKKPNIT